MTVTVLLVPGLRGASPGHWQELLADEELPGLIIQHLPTDRGIDKAARIADLDRAVCAAAGPVLVVGHSAGTLVAMHWAATTASATAMLLLNVPTLGEELPPAYPRRAELRDCGWLPIPTGPLEAPVIVGVSSDDPLGPPDVVHRLAAGWGARTVDLGAVGHGNPAAGFGPWPATTKLIRHTAAKVATRTRLLPGIA
ncbi:RBBP9/YdeN family alpha/beta hydrolase [Flexivirga meconopsidis]|uniref:RBBP9/YdeN family alpha/beta hydrolase n=1 Tax=Flexivirga meconopsidis TaxID=2977121 RepID=UPI00223EEFE1|nr:alpha/beta hydrolase [Flexivirga meconopsidis]